jgi:flagellar assembly factor FliW
MQTIRIQGVDLTYDEASIITFEEGLVGMPHLRQMVLIRQTDIEPLIWMASLDEPDTAFLVVNPLELFPNYEPQAPAKELASLGMQEKEVPLLISIIKIASDWNQSTVNLRAPLFIAASSMRGKQVILTESSYTLNESLPLAAAA